MDSSATPRGKGCGRARDRAREEEVEKEDERTSAEEDREDGEKGLNSESIEAIASVGMVTCMQDMCDLHDFCYRDDASDLVPHVYVDIRRSRRTHTNTGEGSVGGHSHAYAGTVTYLMLLTSVEPTAIGGRAAVTSDGKKSSEISILRAIEL